MHYRSKQASIAAAAKPKAKGKAKGSVAVPAMVAIPHVIQADVKRLIPGTCSVWRNNQGGGWCGHCPPNRRIREMNLDHGSSEIVVKALIKRLWIQHCEITGQSPHVVCFVEGLFSVAHGPPE